MLKRLSEYLTRWKKWRAWRRQRLDWQEEAKFLKGYLSLYGMQLQTLEELVREKQRRIIRLQQAARNKDEPHANDMRPEQMMRSVRTFHAEVAADFDRRQEEYERTGRYERRAREPHDAES